MLKKIFQRMKERRLERERQFQEMLDKEEELEEEAEKLKSEYLNSILGEEYDHVMHAIVPYFMGGTLDLYFYPNYFKGTTIATKEVSNYSFDSPSNNLFDAYELAMCSKHSIDAEFEKSKDSTSHPLNADINSFNHILTMIARYSDQATINPYDTLEFPKEIEDVGGKCFIFDKIGDPKEINEKKVGLMLAIEIHRSEMEYAMQDNGEELIKLLKKKDIYPASDIDREPVI